MIGQMNVLLRLKTLKEEQALRVLQAKRRQVAEGEAAAERARTAEAESAATLSAREDAIFASILGHVVDLGALDDTHGAVVDLRNGHGKLADAVERAAHVLHRLNGEFDTAATAHGAAMRVRDKYTILRDDLRDHAIAELEQKEENEVEELFSKRRRGAA